MEAQDLPDELMEGDLRALYIAWLAAQSVIGGYDEEEDEESDGEDEKEEDETIGAQPVPAALSKAIEARLEREQREQEQQARKRHLQNIHDRQEDYWRQIDRALVRSSSTSYDEATRLLVDLRDAADQFAEGREFQTRFRAWVRPYLRCTAFIKRLQEHRFALPD